MASIPLGSVAPSLGRAFGSGISESINKRLEVLNNQRQAKQFLPILKQQGYSDEEAQAYANLFAQYPDSASSFLQGAAAARIAEGTPEQRTALADLQNQLANVGNTPSTQQTGGIANLQNLNRPTIPQLTVPQQEMPQQVMQNAINRAMGLPQADIGAELGTQQAQPEQLSAQDKYERDVGLINQQNISQKQKDKLLEQARAERNARVKEEYQQKKLSLEERKDIREENKPFVEKITSYEDSLPVIAMEINNATDILKKNWDALNIGPIMGNIAQFDNATKELDSSLSNILLNKAMLDLSKTKGVRAAKLFFELQQQAKPGVKMNAPVLLKRLQSLESELKPLQQQVDIYNTYTSKYGISVPNMKKKVGDIQKIMGRLPEATDPAKAIGTEVEDKGHRYRYTENGWEYIGDQR
jgi:hypothetical protein